eukprot:scaffold576_cov260-Pinguiococcus_pyrenoidosus.AAC.32
MPLSLLDGLRRVGQVHRQVVQEPRMLPYVGDGDPLQGVHHKHLGNEIMRQGAQVRRQAVHAALDLPKQVGNRLVVEWERPAEQCVQDDATAPDIHLGARVEIAGDDLRGRVVRGPARGAQKLSVLHEVAEAEVGDLDVVVRIEQQVLRLEVPMHDVVKVAVLHATDDLLHELSRLVRLQTALGNNVVEKLPARHVLHHNEDIRRRIDDWRQQAQPG